jgi:hypothetical protein
MERCLACEAVVSRGLRDARLSLSGSTSIKNPKSLTRRVVLHISSAARHRPRKRSSAPGVAAPRLPWLESCLLAKRFPSRAGTPAAALIKLFARLGSNKAGGEK